MVVTFTFAKRYIAKSQRYVNDESSRVCIRKLLALAFVPKVNIPQTFYILKDNCPEELRAIFDYYEDYWIKTVDLSLWNMHGILRRTNNNLEGWHLRLNRAVGKSHANIYEFILTLIKEQGATETLLAQIAAGNIRGTSKSTKYNQINKRN